MPLNSIGVNNWEEYFKSYIDERIIKVKPLPGNFLICSVPPFKALGEILGKVAIRFPSARVFQISNQFEVQVRLSLDKSQSKQPEIESSKEQNEENKVHLQRILSTPGVNLKLSFNYPNTNKGNVQESKISNKPTKIYYSLEVHCLALLDVFRLCNTISNYQVEQVYDFWN